MRSIKKAKTLTASQQQTTTHTQNKQTKHLQKKYTKAPLVVPCHHIFVNTTLERGSMDRCTN